MLLALLLVGGLVYFLTIYGMHPGGAEYKAVFHDVLNLQEGAPVRMAGVDIGEVRRVRLNPDREAEVTFRLEKDLVLREGYAVSIAAGALLGEAYVEIVPSRVGKRPGRSLPPGTTIRGVERARLETLLGSTQQLVAMLAKTATSVNRILADPQLANATRTSLQNIARASEQANLLLVSLHKLTVAQQDEMQTLMSNLTATSTGIRRAAAHLTNQLSRSTAIEDLDVMAAEMRSTADQMDQTVTAIRQIMQDPQLLANLHAVGIDLQTATGDVRDTMKLTKEAAGDFREAARSIREGAGKASEITGQAATVVTRVEKTTRDIKLPSVTPTVDWYFMPDAKHNRTWADVYLDIYSGSRRFVRAGVVDLGERNDLNFQLGLMSSRGRAVRYGIVESKLGVGYDLPLRDRYGLSLDLFDPNSLRANVIGSYRWPTRRDEWDVIFGMRGIFRENLAAIGVRTRR